MPFLITCLVFLILKMLFKKYPQEAGDLPLNEDNYAMSVVLEKHELKDATKPEQETPQIPQDSNS